MLIWNKLVVQFLIGVPRVKAFRYKHGNHRIVVESVDTDSLAAAALMLALSWLKAFKRCGRAAGLLSNMIYGARVRVLPVFGRVIVQQGRTL